MDNLGTESTTADGVTASRTLSFSENVQLRRLIVALFLTLAATQAIYFASMALVEAKTHSSAQMGLMIFTSTLPGFLFGMLAGVVVDQWNRVLVLVISSVLRVLVAVGFAAATRWLDSLPLLLATVYVSNFLLAAALQFTISAEGALIPHVVASEQLMGANSMFQVVKLGGQGVGAALLAPVLLRLGGASTVGVVAVPLLALSTWACAQLPDGLGNCDRTKTSRTWASLWEDLRIGWRFVASYASLRWAIGCLVLTSALQFAILTLIPGLAARAWGMPVEYMAYLAVPGGLGFGLGVWLVGRHGRVLREEEWIARGFLALGGGLALVPALQALRGLYILLFMLISVTAAGGFAMVMIPARTLVQGRSPDEMRGRVISTQLFLSNIASTLPLPLMGSLADVVGFRPVIAFLALIVLGAGVASVHHARRSGG